MINSPINQAGSAASTWRWLKFEVRNRKAVRLSCGLVTLSTLCPPLAILSCSCFSTSRDLCKVCPSPSTPLPQRRLHWTAVHWRAPVLQTSATVSPHQRMWPSGSLERKARSGTDKASQPCSWHLGWRGCLEWKPPAVRCGLALTVWLVSLYTAVWQEEAFISIFIYPDKCFMVCLHCDSYKPFSLAEPLIRCCFHCSSSLQHFYPFFFQGKVKVRRASISEPSDTEHEPQALSFSAGEACHLP